jgi:acyl dehydratase
MAARMVEYNDVKSLVGQELGVFDWHLVTQEEINSFAQATHDHQWIHLDVERAKKESPFGFRNRRPRKTCLCGRRSVPLLRLRS